jgi:GNAT superfamily N-acetyltransferase
VTHDAPAGAFIRVAGAADLPAVAALMHEVAPEMALTADELAHEQMLTPGGRRFVAEVGGELAGVGVASTFYAREPEFEGSWTTLQVREPFRRRGIGSALLTRIAEHAAVLGKGSLHMWTSEARAETGPWLTRRGFAEHERAKYVALPLAGLAPPAVDPPPGVELTTLAARPELVAAIYDAALEAEADIPSADPFVPVTIEQWRTFAVDRPDLPYDGCVVALAGAEVVGWASMGLPAARPGVGYHNMTGVRRAWRGRGVAGALKRATIAWAVDRGLDELETENDEANAPMRAINRRLGYRPLPDRVLMRAPLPLPPA